MVFCFVQNFFLGQHELEYLFSLPHKARIFFPEYNIRLYDKNSSDYFFFQHLCETRQYITQSLKMQQVKLGKKNIYIGRLVEKIG
jgi:hypothetical protein